MGRCVPHHSNQFAGGGMEVDVATLEVSVCDDRELLCLKLRSGQASRVPPELRQHHRRKVP